MQLRFGTKSIFLVCVEKFNMHGTIDNVFQLMLWSLDSFTDVNAKDLGLKLFPMGYDKVFQGIIIGVISHM
jgi:hypothetical protein